MLILGEIMKIRYLWALLIAVLWGNVIAALTTESKPESESMKITKDAVDKIVALAREVKLPKRDPITNKVTGQASENTKFCARGDFLTDLSTYSSTIRSNRGIKCSKPVGALLALAVCRDESNFIGSTCDHKAYETLAKKDSKGKITKFTGGASEAKSQLANYILTRDSEASKKEICGIINEILPGKGTKCLDIFQKMDKSILEGSGG
jgi:hypothetical protein